MTDADIVCATFNLGIDTSRNIAAGELQLCDYLLLRHVRSNTHCTDVAADIFILTKFHSCSPLPNDVCNDSLATNLDFKSKSK